MRARAQHAAFAAFVVGAVAALELLPGPRPLDDACITLRYARNLVEGGGFVYNPGERVLGTTTPLYALWLALLALVSSSRDFPWLALVTNAGCDVAAAFGLRRLVAPALPSRLAPALVVAGWLLDPLRIGVAAGGMETPMVVLWTIAGAETWILRGRTSLAAVFFGLAVLTRPDAVVLPALLFLHAAWTRRRLPVREGAAFLAVVLPWAAFATAYFGHPLPASIVAKWHAHVVDPLQGGVTIFRFLETSSPFLEPDWPHWTDYAALGATLLLYDVGARRLVAAVPGMLPLVLFPPAALVGLGLANPLLFPWYFPPFVWAIDAIALVGATSLAVRLGLRAPAAATAIALLALVTRQWIRPGGELRDWGRDLRAREVLYERAARELREHVPAGALVALPEIGVLGYALRDVRVLCTVGLVSPEAGPHLLREPVPGQRTDYVIATGLVLALRPDWLITLDKFAAPTLLRSPEFARAYRLVRSWPTRAAESRELLAFRRAG